MASVPDWKPGGLRLRKSQYFSLSPNAREDQCPSSRQWGRRVCSLLLISYWGRISLFILFRSSTDKMGAIHIGGQSALFSLMIHMLVSSKKYIVMDISGLMLGQISGNPMAKSSWHINLIIATTFPQWSAQLENGLIVPIFFTFFNCVSQPRLHCRH